MLIIGSHVSYTNEKGLLGSVEESISYGSNTFMFYTGAPQNTQRSKINESINEEAFKLMKKNNIDIKNVIIHAPYIVNLANNKEKEKYEFMIDFLKREIERTKKFNVNKIVLHPGSHVGLGIEDGINNISNALNDILDSDEGPIICLETMAGKGTEIGYSFEQLKSIIDKINYKNRVMVCMDTCHINDAGYDLNKFDEVLDEFDRIIGLKYLGCIHINDSKNEKSSHKDRHANIGYGSIGFDNLIKIIYHDKLKKIPKILETPYIGDVKPKYPPYKFEIDMIRNKQFNENLKEDIINYYK